MKSTFAQLRRNISENKARNFVVVKRAASDRAGTAGFSFNTKVDIFSHLVMRPGEMMQGERRSSGRIEKVRLETIDSLLRRLGVRLGKWTS